MQGFSKPVTFVIPWTHARITQTCPMFCSFPARFSFLKRYRVLFTCLIRIHNSEQRCPSIGRAVANSAGAQHFIGVVEQIVHFQVTAPVFAEFVTQVQVYDKVVAGVPIAVAAETGGQQDVVGPVFVFVTQGGLHLMTGYQTCIGRRCSPCWCCPS